MRKSRETGEHRISRKYTGFFFTSAPQDFLSTNPLTIFYTCTNSESAYIGSCNYKNFECASQQNQPKGNKKKKN